MKRLGLVLFVCFCLQVSALSAPFVHLHADAEHETSHHDGRAVHGHFAAHAADTDHHRDHDGPGAAELPSIEEADAADATSELVSPEPAPVAVGTLSAQLSLSGLVLAPPERVPDSIVPPVPVAPPYDDVGHRLSRAPDLITSSPRGPPR